MSHLSEAARPAVILTAASTERENPSHQWSASWNKPLPNFQQHITHVISLSFTTRCPLCLDQWWDECEGTTTFSWKTEWGMWICVPMSVRFSTVLGWAKVDLFWIMLRIIYIHFTYSGCSERCGASQFYTLKTFLLCFRRTFEPIQGHGGFVEWRSGFLPSQACMSRDERQRRREWAVLKGGCSDTVLTLLDSSPQSPQQQRERMKTPDYLLENVWKQ